jgi:hypothetical protein
VNRRPEESITKHGGRLKVEGIHEYYYYLAAATTAIAGIFHLVLIPSALPDNSIPGLKGRVSNILHTYNSIWITALFLVMSATFKEERKNCRALSSRILL